jgi:hypothetical protein
VPHQTAAPEHPVPDKDNPEKPLNINPINILST